MFGLVEEFILPFVMDHTREIIHGESARARAMLQFAAEEAKHIDLFRRFREEFLKGFGHPCPVIGPPQEIANAVLSHDRLGVALTILHIEWMTQKHYVDSAHGDASLDPQFKSLLRHHWMEEAQHAKLDTLMVEAIAEERDEAGKLRGAEQYLEIGCLLDRGLCQQVAFDVECFENVSGRRLCPAEREAMERVQIQANRWTYLGSGMTHPNFVASLQALSPAAHVLVAKVAPAFC